MLIKWGQKLANIKIFFFSLLWLMILVTVGTIAQKDIGLYEAQKIFFSSWIIWAYKYVPLPGGQLTLGITFVGLLAQLIFKSPFKKRTIGVTITHLGSLLLLVGGMLTGFFSTEGSLSLVEGESKNFYQDYHQLEFVITDGNIATKDRTYAFSSGWLKPSEILKHVELPFEIKVISFFKNCSFDRRGENEDSSLFVGFYKLFSLKEAPLSKEDEQNQSCVIFEVKKSENDGTFAVIEDMQIKQSITVDSKKYFIQIRHARHYLPFSLELLDFVKTDYASTTMAKSYKSVVNIVEKKLKQKTIIQMNEPLRYMGYTLYQASYIQENGVETSIFSVVNNVGRLFPYISSIIICLGLLVHLLIISGIFKTKEER